MMLLKGAFTYLNPVVGLPQKHVCFRTATWHENALNEIVTPQGDLLSCFVHWAIIKARLVEMATYVPLCTDIDIELTLCRISTILVCTNEENFLRW